jgi:hypothetical protein
LRRETSNEFFDLAAQHHEPRFQQISIARANSSLLLAECGVEGGDLQPEQVVGACRRASYGESSIRGVRLLNGCSDK